MWYFTWILGLAFAAAFAILNAMWFEMHDQDERMKHLRRSYEDNGSK